MEVRSEGVQLRCDKLPLPVIGRTRLRVWFIRLCSSLFLWTCLVKLMAVGELWNPHLLSNLTNRILQITPVLGQGVLSSSAARIYPWNASFTSTSTAPLLELENGGINV